MGHTIIVGVAAILVAAVGVVGGGSREDDRKQVALLDTQFQAAVKANDVPTIRRILLDDFALVVGDGRTFGKADIIREAESQSTRWVQQDEEPGSQTVRVWGDTAVVTAKLWLKGTVEGTPVDKKVWFSDTYVRTADGWRYAFGQSSLGLPPGR